MYSSSTGVDLPKIETETFILDLSSSISSISPLNEAKGPSVTLTCSPTSNVIDGFDMPIKIFVDGKELLLNPIKKWQSKEIKSKIIEVDRNFYVDIVLIK